MKNRKTLIVDDDASTTELIVATLDDAQISHVTVASNAAAWQLLQQDNSISLVLVRGFGAEIHASQLCSRIRQFRSSQDLPVLVMLREEEAAGGAEALVAGASDLLIGFFEPRELRMRANIVPADRTQRLDVPHIVADQCPAAGSESGFFVPEFDPATKQFTFGRNQEKIETWEHDPLTRRIPLDKVIVCPECTAIPTFRPGCGACGSAWFEQEVLIHHYACAHVGPEQDFRSGDGMICPKCRLTHLVAGSDFEQIQGCLRCSDCNAIFAEPALLGHCLACQHRFAVQDGIEQSIYGYQVGRSPDSAVVAAPNFRTSAERLVPTQDCLDFADF